MPQNGDGKTISHPVRDREGLWSVVGVMRRYGRPTQVGAERWYHWGGRVRTRAAMVFLLAADTREHTRAPRDGVVLGIGASESGRLHAAVKAGAAW